MAENQNPCVALVIGVSDYTAGGPDLESVVRDVDAVPPADFFLVLNPGRTCPTVARGGAPVPPSGAQVCRLALPNFFRRLQVTEGFVSWPGEIDLASDAMYETIRCNGYWMLE